MVVASDDPPTPDAQLGEPTTSRSRSAAGPVSSSARSTPAHPESSAASRALTTSSLWARLIARIDEVFPLLCPSCGGELRALARGDDQRRGRVRSPNRLTLALSCRRQRIPSDAQFDWPSNAEHRPGATPSEGDP